MKAHVLEPTAVSASRHPVGITAAQVRADFLDRSMEATCWNLRQFDPSPEVDSDLEHALEANRAGDRKATERWILAAIDANHREGEQTLSISAAADELSADLERGMFRAGRGIKSLCGELRPILKAIDGGTPTESASALLRFRRLRTMEPNLSSSGVKRELGKKLTAVLEGLV